MSRLSQYEQAKLLVKFKQITLLRARVDSVVPLFLFSFPKQKVRVSFNHKNWVSDWTESEYDYEKRCLIATLQKRDMPKNRSSSTFLVGKEDDKFILACKLLLKLLSFPTTEKGDPYCLHITNQQLQEYNKAYSKYMQKE